MLGLLPILLLLTGCSVLENFNADLNAVGRQIVAYWSGSTARARKPVSSNPAAE